jgi:hypothetical protein
MECATWALVVFTGVLALATIAYAYTTWKLYKGSQDQVNALNELANVIRQLPEIAQTVEKQMKLRDDLMERKIEQMTINTQKILQGH